MGLVLFDEDVSLGVLWIPCVGPILVAVLALVASGGNTTYGASMLFVYSIGMSLPMLSIAYYILGIC